MCRGSGLAQATEPTTQPNLLSRRGPWRLPPLPCLVSSAADLLLPAAAPSLRAFLSAASPPSPNHSVPRQIGCDLAAATSRPAARQQVQRGGTGVLLLLLPLPFTGERNLPIVSLAPGDPPSISSFFPLPVLMAHATSDLRRQSNVYWTPRP